MELKALIIFILGTDDFDKRNRNGREITPPDNPVTAITSDIYVLANTTTDMSDVTEIVTNIEDIIVTGTSTVDPQVTAIVTSSDDRIVTETYHVNPKATEIVTSSDDRRVTDTSPVNPQATKIVTSLDDRIVTDTSPVNTPDSDVGSKYSKYQLKHT